MVTAPREDAEVAAAAGVAEWFAMPSEEALSRLDVGRQGLSSQQAQARLARHGENRLPQGRGRSALMRFLSQFNNVLIHVLLAAAAVTALVGHLADAAVIAGVVVINAVVGFVQEGKAESALAAIGSLLQARATVLRDGVRQEVEAVSLVPGDVVLLEAGERVPADLRLCEVHGLEIDEALLTGESLASAKISEGLPPGTALGDRTNMGFSGTMVTRGQGWGVAVATGQATEIGRIGRLLGSVETLSTPLLRKIDRFARLLTSAILAASVAVFAYGVMVAGLPADEMLLITVGLAVAAIPEGLPAILTIALAIGVERMARRNAIVRRLPAVETLGSITVICTDKTGTLTRNEMTVERVVTADGAFDVDGTGYRPEGLVRHAGGAAPQDEARALLAEIGAAAALASDAEIHEGETGWHVSGDPMEGALVAFAHKVGDTAPVLRETSTRLDVIPFDAGHAYMATLDRHADGRHAIHLKGAPERVIELCGMERTAAGDRPVDAAYWDARVAELASQGHRVLAVAVQPDAGGRPMRDALPGAVLLGLLGIADPPREEALDAVARCRAAGIGIKMITGDHAATARAIAARFGLRAGKVLTGPELDRLDDGAFAVAAEEVDVFARTTPEHKLRLVEALQACGEVVAMTGDGVNDAPALKRADVGVAMGRNGSEAARQVAEIVLADDNFASIAHAVEEGRTVYANLRKSIAFILPTNAGESLVLLAALAVGSALPVTALQILWINMVTTVTLALALAFEPRETDVMARPPRAPDEPLLSPFLVRRTLLVAVVMTCLAFALFLHGQAAHGLAEARTLAVNGLVAMEAAYLFNSRSLRGSVGLRGLLGNRYALGAVAAVALLQIGFTELGVSQRLFGTASLTAGEWGMALGAGLVLFVVVETEKAIGRRMSGRVRRLTDPGRATRAAPRR